jgi:hypothetical protein
VLLAAATLAQAQSQFVNETSLLDAVLERRSFTILERLALDLNRDGVVDVADLVYHLIFNAHLAPSQGRAVLTSRPCRAILIHGRIPKLAARIA